MYGGCLFCLPDAINTRIGRKQLSSPLDTDVFHPEKVVTPCLKTDLYSSDSAAYKNC